MIETSQKTGLWLHKLGSS